MTINVLVQYEEATADTTRTEPGAGVASTNGAGIWVLVTYGVGATISSISDNKGNSYGSPLFDVQSGNNWLRAYYVQSAIGGSGHQWTITSTSTKVGIIVVEDTSNPSLVASSAAAVTDGGDPREVSTGVAAQVGDLVVCASISGFGGDPSFSPNNAGFTARGAVLSGTNTHNAAMICWTFDAASAAVQTASINQIGGDAVVGVFLLRGAAGAAESVNICAIL